MLTLLVPILISYLLEPHQLRAATKHCVQLHDQALQWLMKIGPKYPQEFKSLMAESPELRAQLESAIRNNQHASQTQKYKNDMQNSAKASSAAGQSSRPTIQLKTDFSNFSAASS